MFLFFQIKKLTSNHEIVSLVGTLGKTGMHLHASLSDNEGKVILKTHY